MTLLRELPWAHELRRKPLEGAWVRNSILIPLEVTDTAQERADKIQRRKSGERKWMPWKQVKGWKISKRCFNELGMVWSNHHEWTFDNPHEPKA